MESAAVHSSEVHKVDSGILPSPFSQKEFFRKPTFNSLFDPFGSPSRGQKPQGREGVAVSAIASPGVWSACGACARKGLAGRAYATELRVFVGWRISTVAYPPSDASSEMWLSPVRRFCGFALRSIIRFD